MFTTQYPVKEAAYLCSGRLLRYSRCSSSPPDARSCLPWCRCPLPVAAPNYYLGTPPFSLIARRWASRYTNDPRPRPAPTPPLLPTHTRLWTPRHFHQLVDKIFLVYREAYVAKLVPRPAQDVLHRRLVASLPPDFFPRAASPTPWVRRRSAYEPFMLCPPAPFRHCYNRSQWGSKIPLPHRRFYPTLERLKPKDKLATDLLALSLRSFSSHAASELFRRELPPLPWQVPARNRSARPSRRCRYEPQTRWPPGHSMHPWPAL